MVSLAVRMAGLANMRLEYRSQRCTNGMRIAQSIRNQPHSDDNMSFIVADCLVVKLKSKVRCKPTIWLCLLLPPSTGSCDLYQSKGSTDGNPLVTDSRVESNCVGSVGREIIIALK